MFVWAAVLAQFGPLGNISLGKVCGRTPQTDDGRREELCHAVRAPWNSCQNPAEGARRFLFDKFETFLPVAPLQSIFSRKTFTWSSLWHRKHKCQCFEPDWEGQHAVWSVKLGEDFVELPCDVSLISSHWLWCEVLLWNWCFFFFFNHRHSHFSHRQTEECPLYSQKQSCATLILGRRIILTVGSMMIQDGVSMPGLRLWCWPIDSHHSSASYQQLTLLVMLSSGIFMKLVSEKRITYSTS